MDVELIKQKIEEMAIHYETIVKSIEPGTIPHDMSREALIGVGLKLLGKALTTVEIALYSPDKVVEDAAKDAQFGSVSESANLQSLTSNLATSTFVTGDDDGQTQKS